MAARRSSAIGTEDEKVQLGAPEERTLSRSWMGDAMTLPALKAALAIENGEHSRGFSQRRRAYFIITRHSTSTGICERRSSADVSEHVPHCLARCMSCYIDLGN